MATASHAVQGPTHAQDRALFAVSLGLIVLGLASGFAILPRVFDGAAHTNELVGKPAPALTFDVVANGEEGKPRLSLEELKGHPVVLDFWATWCGPCAKEAPLVDAVARRFKDRGLVVVGVNTSDEPGLAEPYAKRKNLSFPMVYDEGNRAAQLFGVSALPTLVVLDKDGKVKAVRTGVTDGAELERLVSSVL